MKTRIILFLLFIMLIILTSCNNHAEHTRQHSSEKPDKCPDAEIEWIDMLMINDIQYEHYYPDPTDTVTMTIQEGKELGKVTYTMSDKACSNHLMRNGDAAFLEEGTPVYEIEGYPTSFVVFAKNKVYVVDRNPHAKTAGELFPLKGLLDQIHVESTEDGSRIHTFSEESKNQFINAWYGLALEDVNTLHKDGKMVGQRVFLEFELKNGITFRQLYWKDSSIFHNGVVGNDVIKEVIEVELKLLQ